MPTFLKQSFIWQFAAGFALGAVALAAFHPSEAKASVPVHAVQR